MPLKYKPEMQHADLQDLSSQIRFVTPEGKIWLGEQRMLLMQLSSLASFRREMISLIGVERAKGFFLRLGYQSGLKDAELARKLRPDSSEPEIFLAGPQLYALKGLVKVRLLEMDIDVQDGRFNVEAEWINSFEVEICQTELGLMDEPACWTVLGYACGYSSAFMGREIIFQEVSCRGCGDEKCRIIGKTAEEWVDTSSFQAYFKSDPITEEFYELQTQVANLRSRLQKYDGQYYGIGQSPAYRRICQTIDKAARGKVSVLLLGETGVGKEVIARSVHLRSERAEQPFVAINCAAIPPDLIESELFGVDKGAYTGAASTRAGRFERANGGTIFLDEVIELTPRAQATLLRVLQEGELENALERGVILTESNESISVEALFPGLATATGGDQLSSEGELVEQPPANGEGWLNQILDQGVSLEGVEAGLMREAMNRSGQNISQAARLLGLTRPALAYRLKKHDPSLFEK